MSRQRYKLLSIESEAGKNYLEPVWSQVEDDGIFTVHRVDSVAKAERLLNETRFDVVLLDLESSEDIRTLLRVKTLAADAAVIVLSDRADQNFTRLAQAAGATEVFARDESYSRLFYRSLLYVVEFHRIQEEHDSLERILSLATDSILVVADTGEVRYVNEPTIRLLGRSRKELLGESLGFSVQEGGISEITVLRQNGEHRLCELRVVSIDWRMEAACMATLRDITDQRQMEAQLALSDRMVTVGTLAAGVAHEINNPLTTVIGNLELAGLELGEHPDRFSADVRNLLGYAREAADRVRLIVKDLKMLSRSEDETSAPIDVRTVIESSLRMALNETRHRARVTKNFQRTPLVEANHARLGQVLLNLIINAAQAIPEGNYDGNEIRVSTETDSEGNAVIIVEDTGNGIPAHVQKNLFTAFFTTKPAGVGTGLGLAISQRIVASLGGRLSFESRPGEGTAFSVTLPPAQELKTAVTADPEVKPSAARGQLLVIDDEEAIGRLITRLLEAEHDVTALADAADALELLENGEHFDVILCDLMMPQVSGMEFYREVERRYPDYLARIVFTTGGVFTAATRAFLEDVDNHRVDKPFDRQGLRALINALVQ